ncbi:MAG: hypothetical protein U5M23_02775 [Marinagarivorans sp.]|nr:hypothetical protein [Marinagarivorans sp.]
MLSRYTLVFFMFYAGLLRAGDISADERVSQSNVLTSFAKKPLDETRLWLPASYNKYSLALLKAATSALARPRCLEVKRGTLDLSQSTPERAIFRFLCLQVDGQTYAEVIDGNSFTSLVFEPTKTPACYERLLTKIQSMHDLVWLVESGSIVGDQIARWDFDAKTPGGDPLNFKAVCSLDKNGDAVVKLSPRFLVHPSDAND